MIEPTLDDPALTISTVAKIFDVGDHTVRDWIKTEKITAFKVMGRWRILQSEVTRLANEEYGA